MRTSILIFGVMHVMILMMRITEWLVIWMYKDGNVVDIWTPGDVGK